MSRPRKIDATFQDYDGNTVRCTEHDGRLLVVANKAGRVAWPHLAPPQAERLRALLTAFIARHRAPATAARAARRA